MTDTKKTDRIQLRIDAELKAKFSELCDRNRYSISEALMEYIASCVDTGDLLLPNTHTSLPVSTAVSSEDIERRLARLEEKYSAPMMTGLMSNY